MAIASITQWLNDPQRSYQVGKLLYEQYGDNKVVLSLINSGSSSFHQQQLFTALQKVNLKVNLEPKKIVIPDLSSENQERSKPITNYTSAPEQILNIRDEKSLNFAKARKLFESVRVMDSQEHRLEAGLQILDLMDKVNEAWEIIDQWNDSGKIAELKQIEEEKAIEEMNIHELIRDKAKLMPNISKDKKRILGAKNDKDKLKYTQKYEARKQRLALVLERIENAV
jgi:hypothetical protein